MRVSGCKHFLSVEASEAKFVYLKCEITNSSFTLEKHFSVLLR